jgi:UPF0716 family protein affecting phage T7 exclusion
MTCKYKVGDALLSIAMWLSLLAIFTVAAIEHHWGWWLPGGLLLLTFLTGVVMNSKERRREEIQVVRQQRQMALGVPPDEAQG